VNSTELSLVDVTCLFWLAIWSSGVFSIPTWSLPICHERVVGFSSG